MGKAAERRLRKILNDEEIERLQLLSLLKRVGVKKSASADIVAICKSFGTEKVFDKGIDVSSVLATLPKLENLGLVRSKGLYVETLSQFLANRFAKELIRHHKKNSSSY